MVVEFHILLVCLLDLACKSHHKSCKVSCPKSNRFASNMTSKLGVYAIDSCLFLKIKRRLWETSCVDFAVLGPF